MKNKISVITAVSLIALPFVGFTFYQLLKYVNTGKFLLSLIVFICALGAYVLALLSFTHGRKKRPLDVKSV